MVFGIENKIILSFDIDITQERPTGKRQREQSRPFMGHIFFKSLSVIMTIKTVKGIGDRAFR